MTRSFNLSQTQGNVGGALPPFTAGKNKIINGDFGVWQRGTSFSIPAGGTATFTADRFFANRDGSGATVTISQQTFTPGTAPVSGYESAYFYRYNQSVAGTGGTYINFFSQRIEDVRTFAGQTVTVSFWAKADSARSIVVGYGQEFGSGGSSTVYGSIGSTTALTTSWARYTFTATIPSVSGKTIGSGSDLQIFAQPTVANTTMTLDIWGVQVEAGSVATPFTTATGTIQGELAACQRYYVRFTPNGATNGWVTAFTGAGYSTTAVRIGVPLPVQMRTTPTSVEFSAITPYDAAGGSVTAVSTATLTYATPNNGALDITGLTGVTQYRPYALLTTASTGYLGYSAEL